MGAGEFAHSADTLDGRFQHRRVDQPTGALPARTQDGKLPESEGEDAQPESIHARSVMLSDERLGAIARIDLVEAEGDRATPVDYKRGTVPDIPGHVYDPERVAVVFAGAALAGERLRVRAGGHLLRGVEAAGTRWLRRYAGETDAGNAGGGAGDGRQRRDPPHWRTAPSVRAVRLWASVFPTR